MPDDAQLMDALQRHWAHAGKDEDVAHEIYHDDAVLEFPQSGERFEGVQNFREWRRQYPAPLKFHTRRITRRDDLVVIENLISYDGAPWQYSVSLMEFQHDRVSHERIYIWTAGMPRHGEPIGEPRRPPTRLHRLLNRGNCRRFSEAADPDFGEDVAVDNVRDARRERVAEVRRRLRLSPLVSGLTATHASVRAGKLDEDVDVVVMLSNSNTETVQQIRAARRSIGSSG